MKLSRFQLDALAAAAREQLVIRDHYGVERFTIQSPSGWGTSVRAGTVAALGYPIEGNLGVLLKKVQVGDRHYHNYRLEPTEAGFKALADNGVTEETNWRAP